LTLTSATPVLLTTVSGAATIYYTPYIGNLVPIYDGAAFIAAAFSELSNATAQSSTGKAGPAAVTTNSNYDLFVWDDGGTLRLTRGPVWTDDSTRSAGTALVRVNGVLLNNAAITNGPAAQRGTYVGTVRSNGSSLIDYILGAAAAGGTAAVLGVWNMYNRIDEVANVRDTTDSWTYQPTAWRSANNSAAMRISVVRGLDDDAIDAAYHAYCANSANNSGMVGLALDATNTNHGSGGGITGTASVAIFGHTHWSGRPGLGFHYFQATERTLNNASAITFYGDKGDPAEGQNCLMARVKT
jgi:hypothetical protein